VEITETADDGALRAGKTLRFFDIYWPTRLRTTPFLSLRMKKSGNYSDLAYHFFKALFTRKVTYRIKLNSSSNNMYMVSLINKYCSHMTGGGATIFNTKQANGQERRGYHT